MKTIAFILPKISYLPELKAYTDYFTKKGFNTIHVHEKDLNKFDYDIEWHFMGIDIIKSKKNVIKIHDYASLSTPPFAKAKDLIKKTFSKKPDIRIFLNESVKEIMNFKDNIPYCFRDVGVNKAFLATYEIPKEYDFCYLGTMHKRRKIKNFLTHFKDKFKASTILLIGDPPADLSNKFKNYPNIVFTGKVDYLKIPGLLHKCMYGINYIPNEYPFNVLTAVKLIEYCACGLKIISTDYKWVRNFEKRENAAFFYTNENFGNFTIDDIANYRYTTPTMENRDWDTMIENSKILDLINSLKPELSATSRQLKV